jgi:hypothetical protein
VEVAVAELPVGVIIALYRFHLHVDGQQVIAPVGAGVGYFVEEEARIDPFAHRPPVVIGEGDDHGVDLTRRDPSAQLLPRQHPAHVAHRCPVLLRRPRSVAPTGGP